MAKKSKKPQYPDLVFGSYVPTWEELVPQLKHVLVMDEEGVSFPWPEVGPPGETSEWRLRGEYVIELGKSSIPIWSERHGQVWKEITLATIQGYIRAHPDEVALVRLPAGYGVLVASREGLGKYAGKPIQINGE